MNSLSQQFTRLNTQIGLVFLNDSHARLRFGIFVGVEASQFAVSCVQIVFDHVVAAPFLRTSQIDLIRMVFGIEWWALLLPQLNFAIHHVLLEIQFFVSRNLFGFAAFGWCAHNFREEIVIFAEFDQKEFFVFGHLVVGLLLQQSKEEGLDNVLHTGGAFDFAMQILDANQLADGLNHTMRFQTVAGRFFRDVDLRVAELTEVIVEHGVAIAHLNVHQLLDGTIFRFANGCLWIGGLPHSKSGYTISIAGHHEARMTTITTQIATHRVHNFEFDCTRVKCFECTFVHRIWCTDTFARQPSARVAPLIWIDENLLPDSAFIAKFIQLVFPGSNDGRDEMRTWKNNYAKSGLQHTNWDCPGHVLAAQSFRLREHLYSDRAE